MAKLTSLSQIKQFHHTLRFLNVTPITKFNKVKPHLFKTTTTINTHKPNPFRFLSCPPINHLRRTKTSFPPPPSMAENGTAADEDVKYGFQRPEMFKENLAGTVDPYDRHVLLCYGSRDSWAGKIENSDSDPFPKAFFGALRARKDTMTVRTRLTVCEQDGAEFSEGDVLIFPDMIKYKGLKESEVDNFVEEVLVNGKPWASGMQEVIEGSYVFVCAHNSRDKRCGVCGPALIDKFKEEVELRGLKDEVFVSACSHVGGHKYAGNLIIFSAGPDGKVSGHWFGYVAPSDVPGLLDQHIGKGLIIEHLWRGQMGVQVKEAEKVGEEALPNGHDLKFVDKAPEEIKNEERKEEIVTSCCQGANGISCCRDESSDKKPERKKASGTLTCLMGKWERHEVFTAAAVVGAVTTVALAYSLYKRSR